MTAQPPALRPLGIGEILDVSLKIVLRNFGTFVRIVLVVVAPAQALLAIVNISTVPDYRPGGSYFPTISSSSGTIEEDDVWTFVAAALVSLVVGFLASQFATGACFRAVAETYLGRSTDWRASLGFAARRFHSILWIVTLGRDPDGLGALLCVVPGRLSLRGVRGRASGVDVRGRARPRRRSADRARSFAAAGGRRLCSSSSQGCSRRSSPASSPARSRLSASRAGTNRWRCSSSRRCRGPPAR